MPCEQKRCEFFNGIQGIPELIQAGAALGYLWMEGHFGFGDPLINAGAPKSGKKRATQKLTDTDLRELTRQKTAENHR